MKLNATNVAAYSTISSSFSIFKERFILKFNIKLYLNFILSNTGLKHNRKKKKGGEEEERDNDNKITVKKHLYNMIIKFNAKDTEMKCPAFIIYLVDSNRKRKERFIREAYATKT